MYKPEFRTSVEVFSRLYTIPIWFIILAITMLHLSYSTSLVYQVGAFILMLVVTLDLYRNITGLINNFIDYQIDKDHYTRRYHTYK